MKRPALLKRLGIQSRVLLLTVIPMLIISLLLGYFLVMSRLEHAQGIHIERGRVMAHQLADSSEYWLFSSNRERLQAIVNRIADDHKVDWAAVLDSEEQVIVFGGQVERGDLDGVLQMPGTDPQHYIFVNPINPEIVRLTDYDEELSQPDQSHIAMGWAVVCLSQKDIRSHESAIMRFSLVVIILGLLLTLLFAQLVIKSITFPIRRLNDAVRAFRHGELYTRVEHGSSAELGDLESGFNQMAQSLQYAQKNLQQQVKSATDDLSTTIEILSVKNQELEEARQQALAAGKEKEQFLARMSHEIRTPLSAVIGFSRLMEHGTDMSTQREYVRTINQAASQLLSVIDDILSFSRLESGQVELEIIGFDLFQCLEDVVAMLSPAAHEKGLELIILLHSDLPRQVDGDPIRLKQVVSNLVNNAIKFTEYGYVFVEADCLTGESVTSMLRIRVSDTGMGLNQGQQEKIFHAFSQADSSVNRRFGGAGLGLAISKNLVKLMGGEIRVKSQEDRGTTFEITLPISNHRFDDDQGLIQPLSGKRVLLLDPHPLSRRAIRSLLTGWGLHVFNTSTPESLLEMVAQQTVNDSKYDLLIIGFNPALSADLPIQTQIQQLTEHYQGPILLLVGSEIWQPPEIVTESSHIMWTAKPTRRHILQRFVCDALSIHVTDEQALSVKAGHDLSGCLKNRHILSVEDNKINRALLRYFLERYGAQVTEAESGQVAVALAEQQRFDLILMDLHMPGMDGAETSNQIRKIYAQDTPPIIALSADVFAQHDKQKFTGVFDDYVIKPISEQTLQTMVRQWFPDALVRSPEYESRTIQSAEQPDTAHTKSEVTPLVPAHLRSSLQTEIMRLQQDAHDLYVSEDWQRMFEVVHQLSGLVSVYGLEDLTQWVQEIEQSLRKQEYAQLPPLMSKLISYTLDLSD